MKQRGFSLIELLTVIAIIGILAGVISVNVSSSRSKARDAKRQADLSAVSAALEMTYAKNKSYPVSGQWGWSALTSDPKTTIEPYISNIPSDPQSTDPTYGKGYVYCSSGSKYVLDATLERSGDTDITIGSPSTCPSNESDYYQTGTYSFDGKNHYRISGK